MSPALTLKYEKEVNSLCSLQLKRTERFMWNSRWTNIPNCSKAFTIWSLTCCHTNQTLSVYLNQPLCPTAVWEKAAKCMLREVKLNIGSREAVPGVKCCVASCWSQVHVWCSCCQWGLCYRRTCCLLSLCWKAVCLNKAGGDFIRQKCRHCYHQQIKAKN